jgi:hypothetical protein
MSLSMKEILGSTERNERTQIDVLLTNDMRFA